MSLKLRLRAEISAGGPIPISRFMNACLHDPLDGYYATRPRLGEDGDFITAPMVSQMFGELIGAWAVETWRGLGRPARLLLAEAGPGDGTLTSDVLRTGRLGAGFLAAAELWLVETSAPLIAAQRTRLKQAGVEPRWAASLAELPSDAPIILVANEFLDCLPVRQFVRTADGVAERAVGLGPAGELRFGLVPLPGETLPEGAPIGAVVEVAAAQTDFAAELATRIVRQGGAGLLIDYGRDQPGTGDTLQALSRHRKVDPLAEPGAADLTVHADFPGVLAAARARGASTAILGQGEFLRRLGVEVRARALARAKPERADAIARQLARLIDADQMGELFKAACLFAPGQPTPPGFESP
ncbi:MAG TPA: SAM-dependent methyltransferase [Caulobacteraceae bacterium]|jgi:SAM-dependent MidA family methyltransferase|nr:SAM-dependent methyltransferase [Caulobacteraceae bacterium]